MNWPVINWLGIRQSNMPHEKPHRPMPFAPPLMVSCLPALMQPLEFIWYDFNFNRLVDLPNCRQLCVTLEKIITHILLKYINKIAQATKWKVCILKVCVVFKSYHFTLTSLYSALLSLYNLWFAISLPAIASRLSGKHLHSIWLCTYCIVYTPTFVCTIHMCICMYTT